MTSPSPHRFCRRCYGHLAGQVGVALARALEERGHLRPTAERQYAITASGAAWFAHIGIALAALKPGRRGLAPQCLDGTERLPHLGGPLGAALMAALCEKGWLRGSAPSRIMTVTPAGWAGLRRELGENWGLSREIERLRFLSRGIRLEGDVEAIARERLD